MLCILCKSQEVVKKVLVLQVKIGHCTLRPTTHDPFPWAFGKVAFITVTRILRVTRILKGHGFKLHCWPSET